MSAQQDTQTVAQALLKQNQQVRQRHVVVTQQQKEHATMKDTLIIMNVRLDTQTVAQDLLTLYPQPKQRLVLVVKKQKEHAIKKAKYTTAM